MTKPNEVDLVAQARDAVAKHGTRVAAARSLGIPVTTLKSRLDKDGGEPEPEMQRRLRLLAAELRSAQRESADAAAIKGVLGELKRNVEAYDPPAWLGLSKGASAPGVPTLMLSDFHWGEIVHPGQINGVNKFNMTIARERLEYTIRTAVHLCGILDPKMRYPGIVVPLGGDMISGNIHEELQATNELNTMPTVLDLYGNLIASIDYLAEHFGRVFLPCVTGNHGRDTRKIWAKDRHHTSFDWLLYRFLAKHYDADKRITFYIPDGPDAYYKIYGHRYGLTHGDQFRGGDGMIGALGPIIRGDHKKRSRNSQIDLDYDTLLMGHWHQYMHLTRLIVNGSLKGYDEYAYGGNFPFELPTQALWVTHPKYGITYRMPVYCDKVSRAKSAKWVSIPE